MNEITITPIYRLVWSNGDPETYWTLDREECVAYVENHPSLKSHVSIQESTLTNHISKIRII